MIENIEFENNKHKRAYSRWMLAIEMLGGVNEAQRLTGIPKCKISAVGCGYSPGRMKQRGWQSDKRKQCFPTPDQAMRVSIAVLGKIKAEELLPDYDFGVVYQYVKTIRKG